MINFTWSKTHGLVREDEKRLQKRISVLYSSSLKNFCEKLFSSSSENYLYCVDYLMIFYLLQIIPLILLKMWKTHKHCSMFLFQSRVNKFWSIGSMLRAQRTEMKMLLADERKFFWYYAAICFGIQASQGGKLKR